MLAEGVEVLNEVLVLLVVVSAPPLKPTEQSTATNLRNLLKMVGENLLQLMVMPPPTTGQTSQERTSLIHWKLISRNLLLLQLQMEKVDGLHFLPNRLQPLRLRQLPKQNLRLPRSSNQFRKSLLYLRYQSLRQKSLLLSTQRRVQTRNKPSLSHHQSRLSQSTMVQVNYPPPLTQTLRLAI